MATVPKIRNLKSNNASEIINTIKDNSSQNYKNYVPYVTPDSESLQAWGNVLMDAPSLLNEFLNALVNRVALVWVTSKWYDNPYAPLKSGIMEYGSTIEEVFVGLIEPHKYDPYVAQNELYKMEKPDVKTAFHILNYKYFYKVSIEYDTLRQAFVSWDGIDRLIRSIFDQMYTSANYDEFISMKYLIQRALLNGHITTNPTDITTSTDDGAEAFRSTYLDMQFMSPQYNIAGVPTFTRPEDQYLLIDTKYLAKMDVTTLATAFNIDKAEFMGKIMPMNDFGYADTNRLNKLLSGETWYTPFTQEELTLLKNVKAIILDRNWFKIFDYLIRTTNIQNGDGLYYNYDLHVWKVMSYSPFAQAVAYGSFNTSISQITISPSAVTSSPGMTVQFNANVKTNGFAPKTVVWSATKGEISPRGLLTIPSDATTGSSITVTATSTYDSTKTATATVTLT